MTSTPRWLSKAAVLALHERLLAEHGGRAGVPDEGRLEAALGSPMNHFAHGETDIFQLATAYAHALTRDHPFQDGNKRVALTACGVFLELNGHRLDASEQEAVSAILALSTRDLGEDGFAAWLKGSSTKVSRPRSGQEPRRRRGSRARGR